MKVIDLIGMWEMNSADNTDWIPAAVPGTVLSALLDAGKVSNTLFKKAVYRL